MEQEKTLKNKVFESLGAASMCWDERPTGVFDDKSAVIIGEELMTHIESDLPNAMIALKKALSGDQSEGSYYYSWQANIAMAFYDEYRREMGGSPNINVILLEISNNAAKNFLNSLIK